MIVACDRSLVSVSDRVCPLAIADRRTAGARGPRPAAEPGQHLPARLVDRDGADDGDDRAVGADVLAVEGHDVVAGQLADRLDGPSTGLPYG